MPHTQIPSVGRRRGGRFGRGARDQEATGGEALNRFPDGNHSGLSRVERRHPNAAPSRKPPSRRCNSLEYRRQPGQHFVDDRVGLAFQFFAAACGEIEGAGLIAADNAGGLGSGARQRHGEAGGSRDTPTARDGKNHGHFGHAVEGVRRDDQDGTAALLLVPFGAIEPNQPNVTALYQMSSPPTRLPRSHSRSSLLRTALGSH